MGKTNKKKIKLLFCINSLSTGGAEKQLAYISNFLIKSAPFFFEKFNTSRALSTPNPLIWSATKPAFCGESLAPLRYALTSIMFLLFYLLNVI